MAMTGGTLKSLLVKLGVDSKSFDKGMDKAEKRTGSMTKTLNNLGKVGMGVLAGAAVGVGATAVALASTIGPATDLEEAINAVNVVFGEGAKQITDFGKNAAMAVGLSSREFNQMSAEMGAMLGNVGIAEAELGDETISLMERASDMASIFNTDVSQAFAAIQSAIKGEFNPLEQFGVKMNQAGINAKALEMGLGDVNGELDDSAKAQAALALVYEQTDKVAGDFQNTSGGLANSQRQLAGILEDTKAAIGAGLTPALAGLAVMVKDFAASEEFQEFLQKVIAGVTKLGEWISVNVPLGIQHFSNMVSFLKENKGVVIGILAAMGVAIGAFVYTTVIPAMIAMVVAFAPVIAIMAVVGAIAYLLYEAWTNNLWGIQEKVAIAKDWVVNTFQKLKDGVLAVWNTFVAIFTPLVEAFQAAFAGDWHTFGAKIREYWDGIWTLVSTAVSNAWTTIREGIATIIENVITFFTETDWAEVGLNIIKGIAKGITGAAQWIKDAAMGAAKAALDAVKGFLGMDSPSKVFGELGKFSMVGMAQGIDQFAAVPAMATTDAVRGVAVAGSRMDAPAAVPSQPVLDEGKLARMLRDLMLAIGD